MSYLSPLQGTPRGSALFNAGFGANNSNPINVDEWGAGLWSAGYDPNRINQGPAESAAYLGQLRDYAAQNNVDLSGYYKNAPGKQGTDAGYVDAMDWYFRDQSRRQDKTNNFLDTTLGKVLGGIGQVGLGFIPGVGPALAAGAGGLLGARKGGLLGGLLGAAGGYGAGSLGSSLATHGIAGTATNALNSVKGFFGGATPSAGSAAVGAGGALNSINQFFPADIAARSVTSAGLLADTAGRLGPVVAAAHGNPPIPERSVAERAGGALNGLQSGLQLAGLTSGLLGSGTPEDESSSAIPAGPEWAGKFQKFQNPYAPTQKRMRKGIVSNIIGVRA